MDTPASPPPKHDPDKPSVTFEEMSIPAQLLTTAFILLLLPFVLWKAWRAGDLSKVWSEIKEGWLA